MKKKGIAIIALLLGITMTGVGADRNFTARTRVYLYALGGNFHLTTAGAGTWDNLAYRDDTFAPTLGIGFSLLNVNNRFFLNLEGDFTAATLQSGPGNRGSNVLSFMIQGEYRLGRNAPVSVYAGIGAGLIHRREHDWYGIAAPNDWATMPETWDSTLAGELGVKVSVTRRIMFRAALRFYSVVTDVYDGLDYWGGYWSDYWDVFLDDYSSDLYAASVMAGLEIHF